MIALTLGQIPSASQENVLEPVSRAGLVKPVASRG